MCGLVMTRLQPVLRALEVQVNSRALRWRSCTGMFWICITQLLLLRGYLFGFSLFFLQSELLQVLIV